MAIVRILVAKESEVEDLHVELDRMRVANSSTLEYALTYERIFEPIQGTSLPKRLERKLRRMQKEIEFSDRNADKYFSLSKREKEIIRLLVSGDNNPMIARKLFISRRTVEQHRKNINHKLKVHSIAELMPFAYAYDIF